MSKFLITYFNVQNIRNGIARFAICVCKFRIHISSTLTQPFDTELLIHFVRGNFPFMNSPPNCFPQSVQCNVERCFPCHPCSSSSCNDEKRCHMNGPLITHVRKYLY